MPQPMPKPRPILLSSNPLVVDLDHALIKSDLLIESFFSRLVGSPRAVVKLPLWSAGARVRLKQDLAESVSEDARNLPYEEAVIRRIRMAKAEGRAVYLVSAFGKPFVGKVAAHLGVFDGWFGPDSIGRSPNTRADRLVGLFGERGFDYIGRGKDDLPVWQHAATAIMVRTSGGVAKVLQSVCGSVERIEIHRSILRPWIRLLRPHQWSKNTLAAVPLLTADDLTPAAIFATLLAIIAFSLCASSAYIMNDLADIQADRLHPTKRIRPFASGEVPAVAGAQLAFVLLVLALLLAAVVSPAFLSVLAVYYVTATVYSFYLKRKMLIDVLTLAGLYTIRVIGGAVAADLLISEWILAFSMYMFLALALIKRHSEMATRSDAGLPDPTNRDYRSGDLSVIAGFAAAAGYCAVIVFALYISSDTALSHFQQPQILWLVCPLLLYWISRMLLLSHRRLLPDDPIIFALRDRVSWITGAVIFVLLLLASWQF